MALHPDDAAHTEAFELLPWLVNGSLTPDERERVTQHVQRCPHCAREAAQLRQMQAAMQSEPADLAASQAFNRLRDRIEHDSSDAPWWQRARQAWRETQRGWRGALALQAGLLACVLAVLVFKPGAPDTSSQAPSYRTLSAPTPSPAPGTGSAHVTVIFDGNLTEREVRALLLSVHASIASGPTPDGAYVLALDPAQQSQALAQLRGTAHVVFAEPSR